MASNNNEVKVIQLGLGNVGRALLRQLAGAQSRYPWLRLHGTADRSGLWLAPEGYTAEAAEGAIEYKDKGDPLALWCPVLPGAKIVPRKETYSPTLLQRIEELGLGRVVVVDVTGSQNLYPLHLALRQAGHHIVLANKWPLTAPYAEYRQLLEAGDGYLLYETTVGAALPVIRPLKDLVATGDKVKRITASISGTLGYLTTSLQEGVPFSQALKRASELGYTEPDPRLDLGGVDAQRKALILAREIGLETELSDVEVQSLVPEGLQDVPLDEFWHRLRDSDSHYAAQVEKAASEGRVLRYLAVIEPESKPRVALTPVPRDSMFATTRGTESLFVFETERYNEQPLVVRGQGAGATLTASGVLAEVLSTRPGR